jgi:phosphodiesterase/alkaline phosphatase D-like protein
VKLIVASCANIKDVNPQPVWSLMRAERPYVLLLLGDNVYLQHDAHDDAAALSAELKALYRAQHAEPHFQGLLADVRSREGALIAICDDHDFIGNNRYGADAEPALRDAARNAFIEAFSPSMTGTDVYGIQRYGPVDIVVLDERYYRADYRTSSNDADAVLGAEQWQWFENAFRASSAPYVLIASSTTLHAFGDQHWEQYPAAFKRMVSLLRGRTGALIVSGDVHRNAAYDESGVIEIVSSGLAQRSRVFGVLRQNYAVLTFAEHGLHVALHSLQVGSRFDFQIPLRDWRLP